MNWMLLSFVLVGLLLACGFFVYERSGRDSKMLALVGSLAALAAIGRIAFAPIPNVKPTTDLVFFSGYALGGPAGFAVGALAALTSNFFFGQGPWTPWQMAAWGLIGIVGAAVARLTRSRQNNRFFLAACCGLSGLMYGFVMNVSTWLTYSGDLSLEKLVFYAASSLPFDIAHAVGNIVFALAFGPAIARMLARYRAKTEIVWAPAG